MTARFAVQGDLASYRTTINTWRQSYPDSYTAEALAGIDNATLLALFQRPGARFVLDFDAASALRGVAWGGQVASYIDGLPGVRLEEVLLDPSIAPTSRLAAFGALFNDVIALLHPLGVRSLVGECYDDSAAMAAFTALGNAGTIPPSTVVFQGNRPRLNGNDRICNYLRMAI